jgi:hypothetical protein
MSRRKSSLTNHEESKGDGKAIYSHPNTFDKDYKNFRSHNVETHIDYQAKDQLPDINFNRGMTLGLPPTPLKNKRKSIG